MNNIFYTVYDNKSQIPIAVCERAEKCADLMGVRMSSFYNCVSRCEKGANMRWRFIKYEKCENIYFNCDINTTTLPQMIRVSELARLLSTSEHMVLKYSQKHRIKVVNVGKRKIKYICKDKFFNSMESEDTK